MNYSKHVILIAYILIAKCIVVGAVTSDAFKDYDYAYHYSHTDGGFFGGSSTTESTSYKAKDLGSDIVAQEAGTLSAEKDVHLKAGKVAAKDLTLASKSGKVKLKAGEDKDFYHYYHESSGLITTTTDDEGHDRTTQKPVEIAAQTVTLPSPATIDYKAGLGKEFREALAGRKDINWQAVQDNYREWSEHTTTLSGPARMLVACVLTVVTNGMGSEWFAAHGIAEGTATHAALSAGIQAVTVSAGTSFAGNLGDIGKTFDELTSGDFVKSLASTMLTAGLNLGEATTLKEGAIKGAEKIAIQTTLEGRKVGDVLVGNIVDATSAQVAHTIGDAKAGGKLNPLAHKALHAGLGAASAAITGGDALAGAVGATAGEIAAETLHKEGKDPAKTAAQARIIGDTIAFLAGRDVASADSAGKIAVENNFRNHSLEIFIARQNILSDPSLSDEEKQQRLAQVDELAQQMVLAGGKGAALGLAGTTAIAAAPALNTATLAASTYLMSNPTGLKVASLATKGAVGLGTGILAYDYGKTALDRGFGAAFARMQEDAGLMMSVPTEAFANAAKSAFSSAPQEAKAAKTLVQDARPIVTEGVTTTTTATAKPVLTPSTKIGETVVQSKKLATSSKASSKQVELDLGKDKGVVGKVTKSRGFKEFEDLTLEQQEKLPELIGKVGTYDELRKLTRGYGHYIEAHEIPSWAALKYSGSTKPRGENMAMLVLRKDHVRTSTFGQKNTTRTFAPPRQEFARDLIESTRILKDRGIYPRLRPIIMKNTKEEISKNPIYKK